MSLFVRSMAEYVVVVLDAAFDDKEYFLGWIVLTIEGISPVHLHLAEEWKHHPNELLIFVIEEADLSNDFTVRVGYNLRLQVRWQLIDKFFLVELLQVFIMVVLQESFDFLLNLRR